MSKCALTKKLAAKNILLKLLLECCGCFAFGFEVWLLRRISSIGRRCALTKKAAPKTFAKVVVGREHFEVEVNWVLIVQETLE